jgi:hypothetical protein
MKTVGIHEAKTSLSRLIEKACRGEEIPLVELARAKTYRGWQQRNSGQRRFWLGNRD